jgi:hypothetical protein
VGGGWGWSGSLGLEWGQSGALALMWEVLGFCTAELGPGCRSPLSRAPPSCKGLAGSRSRRSQRSGRQVAGVRTCRAGGRLCCGPGCPAQDSWDREVSAAWHSPEFRDQHHSSWWKIALPSRLEQGLLSLCLFKCTSDASSFNKASYKIKFTKM